MEDNKGKTTVADHYFCSASIRPSGCLKKNAICCLHCDVTARCADIKHKGTKPCDLKIMSYEDECPYSI